MIGQPARSPHRAWIEVDHDALRHNLAVLRGLAGERTAVIGVVKANAYGHGAVEVATSLVASGVERLAVATVDEGQRLRQGGLTCPILVLWGPGPEEVQSALTDDLELTVYDEAGVSRVEAAADGHGHRATVHLKIDTGLGRLGIDPAAAATLAARVVGSRHLRLAGTFSHLAVPGEDEAVTETQLLRLARALDTMRSGGIDPGLVHVSATGGILAGVGRFADAVRPGLGLYGLAPDWAAQTDHGLRPILSVRALPLRIFDLAAGEAIGYGLRFRAARATRIATLGIGYGDGWSRSHTNNGWVLVRGQRAPIVGAISMDGLTVDVGEVGALTYADEFTLIGEQQGAVITADEVATARRTINYEVTTALRGRLPRVHLGEVHP